jgi:hypothetical protein
MVRIMRRAAFIATVGLLAASPSFAAFRCGSHLVSEGDSRSEVAAKCGEPDDVVSLRSVFRRPMIWDRGRPYYIGEDVIEVPVENWIYNLGPNKLMRQLKFEGGVLADIATLGYGYHKK